MCAGRGRPGMRLRLTRSERKTEVECMVDRIRTKILTALRLCLSVQFVVPLDTVKELLPALGVPDVLNTDVHPLLDVAVADDLVDDDANSAGGHVVDDTSAAIRAVLRQTIIPAITAKLRTHGSTCGACPFAAQHSP